MASPKSTHIKIPKQSYNWTSIIMQMLIMLRPLQISRQIIVRILKDANSILNSETNNGWILNWFGS